MSKCGVFIHASVETLYLRRKHASLCTLHPNVMHPTGASGPHPHPHTRTRRTLHPNSETLCRKVGRSVGKLYLYESPGAGATLSPSVVYNGPSCESAVFIGIPPYVPMMEYNLQA
jgi:hypothetical protein